jgi:mono/diheme cytochrome c family protein
MDNGPDLKDEIDFRDLLRKPRNLFGYSYIYLVLILIVLGISYMENLTVIGKNSVTPMILSDSSAFVQDIPYQSARVLPPVDVMKVAAPASDLIDKGKALFQATCSSCHGENGEGDGPTAVTLNPKPRNFHLLTGWKNGSKIAQIYKTLHEGIPGSAMASFSYLPPLDRFELIHYVRSLSPGQPLDSQAELQGLETTYQLSKGSNTPGQIPVTKAVRIIENEIAPVAAKTADLSSFVEGLPKSAGIVVFERVAHDKGRIFAGLLINRDSTLQNLDRFIRSVSAEPTQLGFKEEVAHLSAAEWAALFQFMNELKARKG